MKRFAMSALVVSGLLNVAFASVHERFAPESSVSPLSLRGGDETQADRVARAASRRRQRRRGALVFVSGETVSAARA